MADAENKKIKAFKTSKELSQWLKANHASEDELWIKIYKKSSGVQSINWQQIVMETLCWGWIDGVKKSLNDQVYLQRITPRRIRSGWSKKNTEHAILLIAEGRMEKPGLAQVNAAKADGRWDNAYAPASEMKIPTDFLDELNRNNRAKKFFQTLTKSSQYVIAYGLTTAKKAETRQRRFLKFLEMLKREEKPDFGFTKKVKK